MMASTLCIITSLASHVDADTIKLSNGDALTGTLQSFDQNLAVFQSTMAASPLQIKSASVSKITIPRANIKHANSAHAETLTLANNDVIPCNVISMDEMQLLVSTNYAGEFSIPRSNIRSLEFRTLRDSPIFLGKEDPKLWTSQTGGWLLYNNNTYHGKGSLTQKLPLSENIRIKFGLSWRDTPNFVFRFCAENDTATTKQDTYELIFNSAGMQIRRYQNEHQPSALLADIKAINPNLLNQNFIKIDLRVNRSENLLTLYVNSELVGTWRDPFDKSTGNHIIFNNRSKELKNCILTDIIVTASSEFALATYHDKTSAAKTDLLIDSEGEKISGILRSISGPKANKRRIIFDLKHATEPLKVPDHRVNIVLFAKPDHLPSFPEATFIASLTDGGHLKLDKPKLVDGKLSISHPILGPCTLSPGSISSITRRSANPDKK